MAEEIRESGQYDRDTGGKYKNKRKFLRDQMAMKSKKAKERGGGNGGYNNPPPTRPKVIDEYTAELTRIFINYGFGDPIPREVAAIKATGASFELIARVAKGPEEWNSRTFGQLLADIRSAVNGTATQQH
jgi:hypothetical protein